MESGFGFGIMMGSKALNSDTFDWKSETCFLRISLASLETVRDDLMAES